MWLIAVYLLLQNAASAATLTWDASGTSPTAPTDGAGNWTTTDIKWTDGITDSAWTNGNNAVFGSGGAGAAVAVGSGVVVQNMLIKTNYSFNSNTLILSNSPTINVTGSATTATIGNLLGGTGFTKEGAGTLFLNESANNTYTGDTIINNGTLQPGSTGGRLYVPGNLIINSNGTFNAVSGSPGSGVFGSGVLVLNGQSPRGTNVFVNSGAWISAGLCVLNGGVITNANGATSGAYAVTNTDARSGAVWLTRHGFGVFNTIAKSTVGNVVISTRPNASATDGYIATLNAGALIFDYAYAVNAAVKLQANSALTFAGGMLVFSNYSTGLSPSANNPGTGGTFFNSGASSLLSTNGGAGGGNMTMGAITRRVGATLNFVKFGPGNLGSSTANVNGIVGGWNTYNLTDWTTGTSGWGPLAATAYQASTDPTTWGVASNVTLNASTSANVGDGTNINSLRITAASTVTLNGTLTISSGGLLVTGSGATAITGGTLKGGSGADIIVHQNASADLTLSSTLADNGAATSLTKAGAGKLILTGTDNMTGTNYLNGGVVEVSDLAKLASGPLDMNGGTLRYTGSDTTSSRSIVTRGLGPTLDIVGGTTVTQIGAINGSGTVLGDFGGLTKTGAGTLILMANNNFNGETVVSNGVLSISGTNNCNATVWDAGKVTIYGGTLGGTGLVSGPVIAKIGATISPGNSIGTLTLATNLSLESGSTNLFEVANAGPGDLLVVKGNLTIQPNCTVAISISGPTLQVGTKTLITYAGTKTGSFNPTVVVTGGSYNGSLTIDESTPGQINLVVVPQPAIISQPADQIVSVNDNATFTVGATGVAPLSYQWYSYGNNVNNTPTPITDETNASYTLLNAQTSDSGYYSVVVSNDYNSVTSRIASLIVGNVAPVISGPTNKTVIQGNSATFNVSVLIANPAPALQWRTNGVDVTGATGTSVTFNNVQYSLDGTVVSVIATNIAGSVTNSATLTVIVTPVITPQPVSLTVNAGDPAVFTSGATGVPTPGLQWFKNGVALVGETGSTLSFASAQGVNIGTYTLVATNSAGTATSTSVTLTVLSTTLASTTLVPANGSSGICYDTPLYISFNNPITNVNAGRIRIYNVNSATPVDTIDLSSNNVSRVQVHSLFAGDSQPFNYYPVILNGSTAAIYPHSGVLTSNQTYYVTLDAGIVSDTGGAYFPGITDTNLWKFTTKVGGPVNPTNLVVAANGNGDFATVQGAVDSIPLNNTAAQLINIRNGTYIEIVNISSKHKVTFRGQSRTGVVVGYPNNASIAPSGSTHARMAFKVNARDISLDNLTIVNTTPQGGSQAEALMIESGASRCIVNNCDLNGRQDTILANINTSQGYFYNTVVRGNFDFIWGGGNLFFTNCEIQTITGASQNNLTAPRTDNGVTGNWPGFSGLLVSNGFSFVKCSLTRSDVSITSVTLGGVNGSLNGLSAFINCAVDTNCYVAPASAVMNLLLLWEHGNTDLSGNPVVLGITNLPDADPRLLAARDSTIWLNGWVPQLAPNILSQPTNLTVNANASASFNVVATGISDPTYQWLKNGTNLIGQTGATLTIPNANGNDIGSYSVIVSNAAGTVTSSAAMLAVIAPTVGPDITGTTVLGNGNVQFSISGAVGSAGFSYRVWATTNLALTPVTSLWTLLTNDVFGVSPTVFTDTDATAVPQRFYLITVP